MEKSNLDKKKKNGTFLLKYSSCIGERSELVAQSIAHSRAASLSLVRELGTYNHQKAERAFSPYKNLFRPVFNESFSCVNKFSKNVSVVGLQSTCGRRREPEMENAVTSIFHDHANRLRRESAFLSLKPRQHL